MTARAFMARWYIALSGCHTTAFRTGCHRLPDWRPWQAATRAAASGGSGTRPRSNNPSRSWRDSKAPRARRGTGWRAGAVISARYLRANAAHCLSVVRGQARASWWQHSAPAPDTTRRTSRGARNPSWARRAAAGARCRGACPRSPRAASPAARSARSSSNYSLSGCQVAGTARRRIRRCARQTPRRADSARTAAAPGRCDAQDRRGTLATNSPQAAPMSAPVPLKWVTA